MVCTAIITAQVSRFILLESIVGAHNHFSYMRPLLMLQEGRFETATYYARANGFNYCSSRASPLRVVNTKSYLSPSDGAIRERAWYIALPVFFELQSVIQFVLVDIIDFNVYH